MSRRLLFSPYYAILVAFLRLGRKLWGRECMVGLVADARGDAGCYREHPETPVPWNPPNASFCGDNVLCGGCGSHFETEPHADGCPNAEVAQ